MVISQYVAVSIRVSLNTIIARYRWCSVHPFHSILYYIVPLLTSSQTSPTAKLTSAVLFSAGIPRQAGCGNVARWFVSISLLTHYESGAGGGGGSTAKKMTNVCPGLTGAGVSWRSVIFQPPQWRAVRFEI